MKLLVKLRLVLTCDFRKTERTNFFELVPEDVRNSLGPNDVVLLKSNSGTQLVFVFAPESIQRGDEVVAVLPSYRLRLPSNRPWNPYMLDEYAAKAGLKIQGIKTLREHLERKKEPQQ